MSSAARTAQDEAWARVAEEMRFTPVLRPTYLPPAIADVVGPSLRIAKTPMSANTTVFALPYGAWTNLDRADLEKCLARKDYTVDVFALTPSGERRVGGIGMITECGDEAL